MLSKASQYGIRAVLELTRNLEAGEKAGVTELANTLQVPQHFLAKVLQHLVKSGIISSVKGPGGGFFLSETNMDHTLADIVLLFDGETFFSGCILGLERCSSINPCPLHNQFVAYREGLSFHLKDQTIRAFANRLSKP